MSTSSSASSSRSASPDIPTPYTAPMLELKIPENLSTSLLEAKDQHTMERNREASVQALEKYQNLSQGDIQEKSGQEHAANIVDASIALLQAQRDEAAQNVLLFQSVAASAATLNLSSAQLRDLELTITVWTAARTTQDTLLHSAARQAPSLVSQLSLLPPPATQSTLSLLLHTPPTTALHAFYNTSHRIRTPTGMHRWCFATRKHVPITHVRRIWCPIRQICLPVACTATVHFLPPALSVDAVRTILGEGAGDPARDVRNALPLWAPLARAWERGVWALVPTGEEGGGGWKVLLLDEEWRGWAVQSGLGEMTWGELDGRELVWRGGGRPRAEYVYLAFVARVMAGRALWWGRREGLWEVGEKWVGKGRWVRGSVVRAVEGIVGGGMGLEVGVFEHEEGVEGPGDARVVSAAREWVTEVFAEGFGMGEEIEDSDEESEIEDW